MKCRNQFFFKSLLVIFLESFIMKIVPIDYKIDSYLYIYFIVLNLNMGFISTIIKVLFLGLTYDVLHDDICNHSFAVINSLAFAYFIFLKKGKKSFNEDFVNNYEIMKSNIGEKFLYIVKMCAVYHFSLVFLKIVDSGIGFVNFKKEFIVLCTNIVLMSFVSAVQSAYSNFKGSNYN